MSCERTLIADVAYQLLNGKVSSGVGCTSVKYPVLTADVTPVADSKNRVFADTVTLVEDFSFLLRLHTYFIDTLLLVEAVDIHMDWKRPFADTVTLVEALTFTTDWHRQYADTVTVTDAVVKEVDKPVAEQIVLSETFAKKITKVFADTITLAESFSNGKNQNLADGMALVDHGTLLNQGYFDHTGAPLGYFADDYFGDKRTW